VKSDSTRDLLTIFSDLVSANVKKDGKLMGMKGRWCLICRQVNLVDNTTHQSSYIPQGPANRLQRKTSGKCSSPEETQAVECIFVSTTTSTKGGAKKETYQKIITQFLAIFTDR
jgi:hypothetical protein